ncbi:hypothetical protein PPYR_09191 [Photinus pyralis]|uniref:ZAD domain-containing protein n=1 Tax=Photinus pyralis TaxID=7054 RepID=A0A5N4ALV2_PHOPY|nr:hypothetical protein PPYR_09191 [Photinus pyralis]
MNNTQISDICRTCLVASEGMVSIQSKNLINSRYISIIEMLNNCLPFKVSENDKLPKQMCNDCLLCLTNAYTFQQRCLSSVVTLRRSIACDHHNSDGTDKKLITEAFINNEHIQKFACNLCTAYFTSSDDLKVLGWNPLNNSISYFCRFINVYILMNIFTFAMCANCNYQVPVPYLGIKSYLK